MRKYMFIDADNLEAEDAGFMYSDIEFTPGQLVSFTGTKQMADGVYTITECVEVNEYTTECICKFKRPLN